MLWLQMQDPVCVFIYRDPIANAVSLTENVKKSARSDKTKPMTVRRWLAAWEEGSHLFHPGRALQLVALLQLDDVVQNSFVC